MVDYSLLNDDDFIKKIDMISEDRTPNDACKIIDLYNWAFEAEGRLKFLVEENRELKAADFSPAGRKSLINKQRAEIISLEAALKIYACEEAWAKFDKYSAIFCVDDYGYKIAQMALKKEGE